MRVRVRACVRACVCGFCNMWVFGSMCTCIYCVLYCLSSVFCFVSFRFVYVHLFLFLLSVLV